MKTTIRAAAAVLLLAAGSSASAQSVNWGHALSLNNTQSFLSDGSEMPAGFEFELGYFSGSFVPTAENAADWDLNWISLQAATFPNDPFNGFTRTLNIDSAASDGKPAYIWAFNDEALMGTASGEGLLVTNPAWTFPAFGVLQGGAPSWTFHSAGNVAVVGSILSGTITDSSSVTDISSPAATHVVQTATWTPVPVPEPGVCAMVLCSAGLLLRRRRR